ncbi:MAG: hypothetical protein AB7V40_00850 [Methyloceanibacter sp.]
MRFAWIAALASAVTLFADVPHVEAARRVSSWSVEVAPNRDEWRHYYRRYGEDWRRYYRPPAPPAPVRPLSCGEFRFWDGDRCVDVRFR